MDCLICYKIYIKEIEYKDSPLPSPELCANAISKLLRIPPSHPDVKRIFEDDPATPLICARCHHKLVEADKAMKALTEMEELQRRVDSARIEIRKDLDYSKDVSEVMAKIPDHIMSKASLGRLTILKAIRTGSKNEREPARLDIKEEVNGYIEISETFREEEVEQFQSQIDQMENDAMQGPSRPPPGPGLIIKKEPVVSLKRLQIPPKAKSTLIFKPNKSNPNYGLKRKPAKREQESISESESSEGETSEKEAKSQAVFQCQVCSKILLSKTNLNLHETLHTGQFNFKCQHCSRGFISKYQLRAHLGKETPTKCTICNETFKSRGCLKQHDWKVHGTGDYARVHGSVFKNYTRLADGKFKCNRCSKIIAFYNKLRSHTLIHEPRSYPCRVEGCGKKFMQLHSLREHVLSIHEGMRYPCQVADCGRTYTDKSNLSRHVKMAHSLNKVNPKKMDSAKPHKKPQRNQTKNIPSLLKKKKHGPLFKCRIAKGQEMSGEIQIPNYS